MAGGSGLVPLFSEKNGKVEFPLIFRGNWTESVAILVQVLTGS